MESLWYAQEVFKNEGDGGLEGARLACRAVTRFVGVRHVNPELAAPFTNILRAFDDLEKGGSPELFSKDVSARRRSRSSASKHCQVVAAALMQALMDLGETYDNAATTVARATEKWSVFGDLQVTPTTVRNWRDACRRTNDSRHEQFERMTAQFGREAEPRVTIDRFLTDGPPDIPRSQKSPSDF